MTSVYEVLHGDGFEFLVPERQDDWFRLGELWDFSAVPRWRGVPVSVVHNDEGRILRHSDLLWIGQHEGIAIDSTAWKKLEPLIGPVAPALPLSCSEGRQLLFFQPPIIDALDRERSGLVMLTNRVVLRADHLVFHADRIFGLPTFRIDNPTAIYFSEEVVECIESHRLSGFSYELAWSDS